MRILYAGLSLIFIASNINVWLTENDDAHMTTLTYVFSWVNALAATNDIAIDGWTLTLLRRYTYEILSFITNDNMYLYNDPHAGHAHVVHLCVSVCFNNIME